MKSNKHQDRTVKSSAKALAELVEIVSRDVDELGKDSDMLGNIRATLVLNFGPNGTTGKKHKATVENYNDYNTHDLMIKVLKNLCGINP
jgi:hypothetical protein